MEPTLSYSQLRLRANGDLRPPIKSEKGEFGHIAKKCSAEKRKIKCCRCGEIGHTPRYCEKPRNMERGNINIISTENQAKQFTKYIKHIKLNNSQYVATIDTGSSKCIIKASLALLGNFNIN
ncbi:hypothetical protein NQ314_009210 [Rhamnusium bicolor]|uniref:CCHC-type domain-containing protein n=1 Tax=Rhamnusium bicolor TaxID=1586634 RepID=A0AAV8Y2L5_9CUCU|nr:hypothetical protein NQ314_009210 [Rhamnusium bicolor]